MVQRLWANEVHTWSSHFVHITPVWIQTNFIDLAIVTRVQVSLAAVPKMMSYQFRSSTIMYSGCLAIITDYKFPMIIFSFAKQPEVLKRSISIKVIYCIHFVL